MIWHLNSTEETLKTYLSSREGIGIEEAGRRLLAYGPNEMKEKKKRTLLAMFLDQFRDFMILILIVAAFISGFLGEVTDTIAIIVIIVLNAVIGFIQEYRAEKALEALKKMAALSATIIREGKPINIAASQVVPGDVVILEAGKAVPADLRLIEAEQLKVEEAALTGESVPVEKHTKPLHDKHLPLGDRKNMAYKGTFVTYGRGSGVVVATGMETELGKIAAMLQEKGELKTPLQKRLIRFSKILAYAVLAICSVVFGVGVMRGESPMLMLLTAISLAVAAVPEALPAVVTISLALSTKKMVKQNVLIRKLPAVETLGSVTYICSDKTGTLTLNKMTVEEVYADGKLAQRPRFREPQEREVGARSSEFILVDGSPVSLTPAPIRFLMTALALSNDAYADASGNVIGDPTEAALFNMARENGFAKADMEKEMPRVAEIPFDSDRKCMTTFHRVLNREKLKNEGEELKGKNLASASGEEGNGRLLFVNWLSFTKGAIEVLSEKADFILTSMGLKLIDRQEIHKVSDRMAAEGLRVLGIAMKSWKSLPDGLTPENVENGLVLIGLVGMMDPPREEAAEAVSLCKTAGIKSVMITGDHPLTARAIARRLGILEDDAKAIITGRELERLTLEEFEEKVEQIRVYARAAPDQKLKIVKALQDRGQFVAMTGDGVNDAPALKQADIGVAMGITGTDVSKETADMILLDDNFATIVNAVKEGRRIFDNLRKFIKYTMTSNSGEIWVIFLAPFFGLPIPLLPIHILWINLVTDGLPGLALAAEPAEKGIMKRPPRHPQESIFAQGLGTHIVWVGLLMGFTSIFTQALSLKTGHAHWQTMVFTVLCLSQMGHVLAIRSERESLFRQGLFSNKPLLGALFLTFVLQMATIYVPFLNPIFKTQPLTLSELAIALMLSSVVFIAVELEKLNKRKFKKL